MSLLQLQQLSIPYINSNVSDIWQNDIHFQAATYYHIQAASGKGKSSLIQTLYGLQTNYNGQVVLDGKIISSYQASDWCRVRSTQLSIVFQDLKLFDKQTALKNIQIKQELTNTYPDKKIFELAERLSITHTLQRNIETLSYGERQRVAIIRALMQPFQLLLLDEPFSHLDEQNIIIATELINEEVTQRNATLIMTDLEDDQRFPYHQTLKL